MNWDLRNMKSITGWGLVWLLLGAWGCTAVSYFDCNADTPQVALSVNAFGNYDVHGKSFFIESGDPDIKRYDIEFQEYANYVARSLELQGAVLTEDREGADMCVLLNYGISDNSYVETVPVPIWGQTGISSITTTTTTAGSADGFAVQFGNLAVGSVSAVSQSRSTTTVNPSFGITGYSQIDYKVSNFCRTMNIYCYDNHQTVEPVALWKTLVTSCGGSSDFRIIAPYMAYAAFGRMGVSTEGKKTFAMLSNDYFYRLWKQDQLDSQGMTILPQVAATTAYPELRIALVDQRVDETLVVVQKSGCLVEYGFLADTYLVQGASQIRIRSIDEMQLGQTFRQECGVRYLTLRFPALPNPGQPFDLIQGGDNGMTWRGIRPA